MKDGGRLRDDLILDAQKAGTTSPAGSAAAPARAIYLVSQRFHIEALARLHPAVLDVRIVVTRPRLRALATEHFPGATQYDVLRARAGEWADDDQGRGFQGVSAGLLAELAPCEAAALAMLDRWNWTGASVMALRAIYLRHVEIWDHYLRTVEPDVVLFHGEPHRGFDWVLYGLCRSRSIPVCVMTFTQLDDRLLLKDAIDTDAGPDPASLAALAHGRYVDHIDVSDPVEIEVEGGAGAGAKIVAPPSYYVRAQIPEERKTSPLRRGLSVRTAFLSQGTPARIAEIFRPYPAVYPNVVPDAPTSYLARKLENLRVRRLIRRSMAIYDSAAVAPELDSPFVYYPLHFQPEATTLPMGGHLYDQLNNIRMLATAVPDGWRVVVKEHPQMLRFHKEWPRARGTVFYEALRDIPGVVVVPIDHPSQALTAAARAVATTTGTAGWEAILAGRRALVFGCPWYATCPGVHRVGSLESCAAALVGAEHSDRATERALVQTWVDEFTASWTIPGAWDDPAADHSSTSRHVLLDQTANGLARWLATRVAQVRA